MAVDVAPSPATLGLLLERDGVAGPARAAQAGLGELAGALGGIADAHNALAGRLQRAQERLDPLVAESAGVLRRLRALEERCRGLPGELRAELRAGLGERAEAQAAELRRTAAALELGQESRWQAAAELLQQQVAAADERRQRAVREAEGALSERLCGLERSLERLAAEVREQGEGQQECRAEHQEIQNSTLPRLRSDLVARVEGLGAGLSERADGQATRTQRAEKQLADHGAELEKVRAALEMRALASKLAPLDARLIKAEEVSTAAARALTQEIAQLEAQISSAKTALCEQMQAMCGETKKAARVEATDVINTLRAKEDSRLCDLERALQQVAADHGTFVEKIGREISGTRQDIKAGRDWAARRIESLAETTRQLESAKQPVEAQPDVNLLDQVSDLDHRQCSLDRRQEKCDSNVERIEKMLRALLAAGAEHAAPPPGDVAGAVTKCLSCGRQRSLSPCARSPSPEDPPAPGRPPQAPLWAAEAVRPGPRAPRSRPASAGRHGTAEAEAAAAVPSPACGPPSRVAIITGCLTGGGCPVPAGSAHTACRAIGPTSPRRQPRPGTVALR